MAARPPARKPTARTTAKAPASAARSRTRTTRAKTAAALEPKPVAATDLERLPDTLRDKFLALLAADKTLGNTAALRRLGVTGTKAELKTLLDEDLIDAARAARGHTIGKLLAVEWEVALDKNHAQSDRARSRLLRAYVPEFRESVAVEHGGRVEVDQPDVAAAVDRFTSTIQRLAQRAAVESGGAVRALDAGAADPDADAAGG